MVGVFVTFRYETDFDPSKLAAIAEGARAKFEGMPGLRNKIFTVDEEHREATNVYVWESREAAQAFFTDELLEQVTRLYGVRPSIRYAEIAELVDNSR